MRILAAFVPPARIMVSLPALAALLLSTCGVARATLPTNAYFTEDFNYALGTNLVGKVNPNGTWQGTATNQITIDTAGPQVKMTGGLDAHDAYQNTNYSGRNGVIWVHFKAYRGAGGGATMWTLRFDDTAGNNLARFYGASDTCRGRIGDTSDVTGQYNLTQSAWNDLDIKINTTANTSEFFLNNASIGALNHGTTPNNTLGKIKFERVSYDPATGHTILFDELRVGEEPWNPTNPKIIPEPQQLTWKPGTGFRVDANTRIVMSTSPDSKDTLTANQLRRKVWDMTGYLPQIVQGSAGAPTANVIAIGDPARNTSVSSLIASWPEAAGKTPKSEGYLLGIGNDSVVIRGFDQRGTFYGCQTLIQLLENYGSARVDGLFCYDYPDLAWRGMFVRVGWDCDWEFPKEIITEVMARYKMNYLEPAVGKGMVWEYATRPLLLEPADRPIQKQDFVDLVNYARDYFVDYIACGPGWNHSDEWLTIGSYNEDLREDRSLPDQSDVEDLCPRNVNAQNLVKSIRQELMDMLHPTYMHIGQSEYASMGASSCPHCGSTLEKTLFNEFLWNDWNDLSTKNPPVTPVMWGDMLRQDQNGAKNGWNTYQVVSTMPDGIIVQDWEYGTPTSVPTDYPSLQTWNNNGLQSMGAPFGFGYHTNPGEGWTQSYGDKENIYYWANAARNYGVKGIIAFNKLRYDDKRPTLNSDLMTLQLACYPFVAEWGWTPTKPNWSPYPYDGRAMVFARLAPDRPVSFAASMVGENARLTWTNPADFTYQPSSTFQGTYVCYRTDRYPTEPIDGIFVCDLNGSPNGSMSFTHAATPLGATVYFAAFSHDGVRHFSPPVTASVANGSPLALADLSSMPDGRTVNVAGGVVTSIFQNCFYVQTEKRINGLRVESTEPVIVGQIVTVNGTLGKTGHERSIAALSVAGTGQKLLTDPCLKPFALNNATIGGTDNGTIPGSGGVGANNVGSLVITAGKVENRDPGGAFFYVNDGSVSGGIKVKLTGTKTATSIPGQSYVAVVGVSSLDTDGKAIIWPRSQADVVSLN